MVPSNFQLKLPVFGCNTLRLGSLVGRKSAVASRWLLSVSSPLWSFQLSFHCYPLFPSRNNDFFELWTVASCRRFLWCLSLVAVAGMWTHWVISIRGKKPLSRVAFRANVNIPLQYIELPLVWCNPSLVTSCLSNIYTQGTLTQS